MLNSFCKGLLRLKPNILTENIKFWSGLVTILNIEGVTSLAVDTEDWMIY